MNPASQPIARDGLTGIDHLLIVLYMIIMLGFGWWFSRRQASSEDYFVGGRKMPWFITGVSVFATLMSTITYLALPGEMIKKGLGILNGQLALPLAFCFVSFLIMPFYKHVPVTSAYEYLEKRFGLAVRWLGAALFLMIRVAWMSLVIYTASMALAAMTAADIEGLLGIPQAYAIYFIIGCVGVIATVYTCLGGIQAVIWTDFVQFVILFGGVVFSVGYVAIQTQTGPLQWYQDAAVTERVSVPFFSFNPTERITVLGIIIHVFFWQICTHGSDQVAVQRYLSTASLHAARRSLAISLLCDFALAVVLCTCGLALFSFYSNQPDLVAATFENGTMAEHEDKVFPRFIATQLPPGVAGLVVAALFAAAMSSLDSGVNSVSTVVTVDFYRRLKRGAASDGLEITLARWITIGAGLFVTGSACLIVSMGEKLGENIVEMTNRINSFVVGPLAGLFFSGMLNRRCSGPAIICGVGVGLVWGLFVTFSDSFLSGFERVSFIHIIWSSCLMTVLVAAVASVFIPERRDKELVDLTRGVSREN